MAARQPVWGIDVGQCSLKAIKLQAVGEDQFELVGFDLVEHPDILSQSDDATELVAQAIATFAGRNDMAGSKLVIAVPGQQTLTKFTKMPPVEKKKIPDMVQYEASQQIPFDMDEVVWDYQIFGESEGTTEIEVGIFAIRKELIRNYLMLYTEVDLEPQIVQTSPIASYNTARFEMPMPEGEAAVLLDMGAVSTDLIVIDGDRIWSRPVPIGGNKFTEALVSAFKIGFKKAEKLKRNAASSKYAKQIFQAMRPVFADLVSEVQRSIGFYTSTHRDANITRIIGMGNAFKLPGLQKFLQLNLQVDVAKLGGFQHLRVAEIDRKDEFLENVMSMAVCYGLAVQGMGLAKVQSSLLPIEFRRQILWKKKKPWFIGAAAMVALGAGSIWASNMSAASTLSSALGDAESIPSPNPNQFPSDEAAYQAVIAARSNPQPIQKAVVVASGAQRLKNSLQKADVRSKDLGKIKTLAKYPDANLYVPRILDVIHEAVGSARGDDIAAITAGGDYARFAKRKPRGAREEIWIEDIQMDYSPAPDDVISDATDSNRRRGKAGWWIRITGITPLDQPASWLESGLMREIQRLGRRPDRGIYFDTVSLADLRKRGDTRGISSRQPESRGGGGRRGAGRRVDPGRPGAERPTGRPAGRDRGFGVPGGREDSAEVERRKKLQAVKATLESKETDFLTGESTEGDSRFVIEIIVRRDNTPKDLIPEEFREKPDAEAPGKP